MKADRNKIVSEEQSLVLEKVDDFSIFKSFSCGDKDLNDCIRNDAKVHKKELLAETYMLRLQNVNQPIAFCSLCNDLIQFSQKAKKTIIPEKKQYRYHPAVKIARIGVIKDLQSQKFGSHLIDLIKHLFVVDNRTGCRFITVDAYNKEKVLSFYQKMGQSPAFRN